MHVLGAGALGTLWAAHHPGATLLLREGSPMLRAGRLLLRVRRGWTAQVHEASVPTEPSSDGPETPIRTLVVATKAYAAAAAVEGVRRRLAPDAAVVLLCNGAMSLADALELPPAASLLVATTTHGAWLHAPPRDGGDAREVQHAGNGSTWVGPVRGSAKVAAAAAAEFAAAGLGAVVESADETQHRLWLKLAANAVLNPLTALWNVRNGEVLRRAEGRATADAVCAELAALAAALAPPSRPAPSAAALRAFVGSCAEENAANWSSMHQDVAAGRRTEIDHLNGWVAARARALGMEAPANARLATAVAAGVLELSSHG